MSDDPRVTELGEHIARRAAGRGLSVDLARLRYASESLLAPVPRELRESVLCVGVGHGHDVLLDLLEGRIGRATGVDPFNEADGNGDEDFAELRGLIASLGLADRFEVKRSTVVDFLERDARRWGLILMSDVLHHIFVTRRPLRRSGEYEEAVALFRALHGRAAAGGVMVISDVRRSGLRARLHRMGILGGEVEYATKQEPGEWRRAVEEGGWRFARRDWYVPWALRGAARIVPWAVRPACDRYRLYFTVENGPR
ncbi:MAG: methyltransferase domain-containing protein [Chlamydiota bacterium]